MKEAVTPPAARQPGTVLPAHRDILTDLDGFSIINLSRLRRRLEGVRGRARARGDVEVEQFPQQQTHR